LKFLVDANVLSERTKPDPSPRVVDWLRTNDRESVVNPIVLGELEYGVLLLPSGRRKRRLLDWFNEGIRTLDVIAIDAETSNIWAKLLSDLSRKGRSMPLSDSLIAASALQHGLTVVTRNVAHYRYAGMRVVNPFEPA
jgi:predicted nucleic acid-binding protein